MYVKFYCVVRMQFWATKEKSAWNFSIDGWLYLLRNIKMDIKKYSNVAGLKIKKKQQGEAREFVWQPIS